NVSNSRSKPDDLEFMLAANISVAKKILEHFPLTSLLRRHPSPTKEMLEPLIQTATAVGLCLDVTSSKALADSLDQAVVSQHTIGQNYD
ncbi:UNVERIFIED_CONTAM: Exosome complex exonuclease RRP44A, partial [Sesamum angustifolium]